MRPVTHDSGGRFDAGVSRLFLKGWASGVLPPGHYEPGAPSALTRPFLRDAAFGCSSG
jgi:hypothetical protein